ncbi:MAG: TlpA family protein disulfide reductase [Pseudomonadota bacterium]|nr:TlpA family protein disulfide reductase [Pseudomonadota bacterium]
MNRASLNRLLLPSLVALSLLAACKREAEAPVPAPVPQPAPVAAPETPAAQFERPALKVTTVDGASWDLAAHRGKWVVVNFWATWCAPCRKEMPELSALDAMREHIEVIGLAYEETTPAELQAFLEEHPVVYPVALVDVYDPPADFETPRGLPMTYLIAPDGKVAKRFLGPVTAAEIEAAIASP